MNSSQLFNALRVILKPHRIKIFDVLAANEVEPIFFHNNVFPKVFIVNMLPSNSKILMGHWLVIYALNKNNIEVFDSFGKNLLFYNKRYFNKIASKNVVNNNKSVQNIDSLECGKFCLYFIAKRLAGFSMQKIKSGFSRNTRKNDEIVDSYYKSIKFNVLKNHKCTKISCSKREFLCRNIVYCK